MNDPDDEEGGWGPVTRETDERQLQKNEIHWPESWKSSQGWQSHYEQEMEVLKRLTDELMKNL